MRLECGWRLAHHCHTRRFYSTISLGARVHHDTCVIAEGNVLSFCYAIYGPGSVKACMAVQTAMQIPLFHGIHGMRMVTLHPGQGLTGSRYAVQVNLPAGQL